jgi:hypothetical protein
MRIEYKLKKYPENKLSKDVKEDILRKKQQLRDQADKEILSRLNALRKYLRTPERDPHLSLEEIFRQRKKRKIRTLMASLVSYLHNRRENHLKSS